METNKSLTIPFAIVIAGAIVGGAILLTQFQPLQKNTPTAETEKNIPAVTNTDRILGDPNAPIMVIEYSDASCPFCKTYHNAMTGIMEDYIKLGKVAWVYRHYPLDKPMADGSILHPNTGNEAHAMECVGDLGGNGKFFEFTKRLYEITPSVTSKTPNGLDQNKLPEIAKEIGLNETDFTTCMKSGKFKNKIEADFQGGNEGGVLGTPFTFVITKSGKNVPIEGARMSAVKTAIDSLIVTDGNN